MTVYDGDGGRLLLEEALPRLPSLDFPESSVEPGIAPTLSDIRRKLKGDRKTMLYLLTFVFVMGLLVFVHEFGHFVVAKRYGVAVTKFSLGFGPKIAGFKRGETEYVVSAIPMGGFVALVGERPSDVVPPEMETRAFRSQSPKVKFLVALAGPGFNAVFAFLMFWFAFVVGAPMVSSKVGAVTPGLPAARSNMAPGDVIVRIDGRDVSTWVEVTRAISGSVKGKPVAIEIVRDGVRYGTSMVPEEGDSVSILGEKKRSRLVGLGSTNEPGLLRLGFFSAAVESVRQCRDMVVLVAKSVWMLITGALPMSVLGGPLKIAIIAGTAAQIGFISLVTLLAALSINLGVLNLLPIPVLDGGHIAFSAIEALIGKPVGQKTYSFANWVGVVFVVTLTVMVIYNDLVSVVKAKTKDESAVSSPVSTKR